MAKIIIREGEKVIKEYPLEKDVIVMGREETSDIVLADRSVSRKHDKIFKEGDKVIIEDLASANGTFLNGGKITRAELKSGDEIGIGKYTLSYQEKEASPAAPADAEKTVLFAEEQDKDATRIVAPQVKIARLVVIEGPDTGKEFLLGAPELVIGRAEGNEIILEDKQVSRKHAKLTASEDVYTITDLDSNNGIYINKKKVKEQQLQEGDEIAIGPFKLKLATGQEIGTVAAEGMKAAVFMDRLPGSLKKPLVLAAAGVTGLVVIIVLISALISSLSKDAVPRIQQSKTDVLLKEGAELYSAKRWAEAVAKFEEALEIEPENKKVQDYLSQGREACYFWEGVDKFRASKWEEAIMKFNQVLAINSQKEEARQYIDKAQLGLDADKCFNQGWQFYQKGQWEQAIVRFKEALTIQPDHAKAGKYLNEAEAQLSSASSFEQGLERFKAGKYIEAIAKFKKIEVRDSRFNEAQEYITKANSLLQIKEYLTKADSLYASGNVQEALGWYNKILEIDKSHPGLKETVAKAQTVGDCYRMAQDLRRQGKILDSVAQWRKILSLEKSTTNFFYKEASRYLDEIKDELSKKEDEARELYRAAYVLRSVNPEKAVENWKKILELVPPDNEYYVKAKNMLEKQ